MKKIVWWALPGVLVLAADGITKRLLFGRSGDLIPGVIALKSVQNTGMALGLFQGGAPVIVGVSVLLALLAAWLLRGSKVTGLGRTALSMMAGGAVGNLIDRLALGYVRDLFDVLFMDFYVFNIADAGVVVGAVLCGVSLLFRPKDWRKT